MASSERIPIWQYRPRDPAERRKKYHYCIDQGLTEDQARSARDWDWPRIYKYIRQMLPVKVTNDQ